MILGLRSLSSKKSVRLQSLHDRPSNQALEDQSAVLVVAGHEEVPLGTEVRSSQRAISFTGPSIPDDISGLFFSSLTGFTSERNQLWAELTAAAYNLVRMAKLAAA